MSPRVYGARVRAARAVRAQAERQRDILNAQALAHQLGRTPLRKELERDLGIWFGATNLWPDYRTFVAAMGGTPEDGRRYRYSKDGTPRPRPPQKVTPLKPRLVLSGVRRCEACVQLTDLSDACRHCGAPWTRTRAA